MNQREWDCRFLKLARHVSTWSKDPSTKVGAIVAKKKKVYGHGYNGFPKGVRDLVDRYENRELKNMMVVHAEENACIDAGRDAEGASMYVFPTFDHPFSCHACARTMIQYGIREVVGYAPSLEGIERAEKWKKSLELARIIFEEAGIIWRDVSEEDLIE